MATDSKLCQYIKDTFSDFDKDRIQREHAWSRWYAMFRGVFEDNKSSLSDGTSSFERSSPEKSKLYINQTKQSLVVAISNVMSILFQKSPPFSVVGRSSKLDDEMAKMIQDTVWYFLGLSKFPVKARRYITRCAIYGTAYAKVFMDTIRDARIEVNPVINPIIGTRMGVERVSKVVETPMVRFDNVDIYDIWEDPENSDTPSWGRGVYQRVFRTKKYIEDKIKRGIFRDFVIDDLKSSGIDSREKRRGIEGLPPLNRDGVELFEFWGLVPDDVLEEAEYNIPIIGEETEIPAHIIYLSDGTILLSERNPIIGGIVPYIKDVWEDLAYGSMGRGIPENTQGPQMALNATINSRLDNKSIAIQQLLGVDVGVIDDPDDLRARSNWIIRTNGSPRDALYPISIPDMTAGAYIEAKEFERIIEESSGFSKFMQGTESFGSNRTASGIATVFQAASQFLRDITGQMEHNLIAGTAQLVYKHILQFMPDEFLISLTENPNVPEYKKIALEHIAADIDFIPSGVQGLMMKEVQMNQLIQFAQGTANPVDAQYVNRPKLLKKIYEMAGFKDSDEIITTPQVPPGAPGVLPTAEGGETNIGDILSKLGGSLPNLPAK